MFGVTSSFVRKTLVDNGQAIRKSGTIRTKTHGRLSDVQSAALKQELTDGALHAPMARKYGVTREWVRQLAKSWGLPSGKMARDKKRADHITSQMGAAASKYDLRTSTVEQRYEIWRDLWQKGYTAREMATTLGLSARAVAIRICLMRRLYQGWFPTRRPKLVAQRLAAQTMVPA